MPHNRVQTALYWGCPTIGVNRDLEEKSALPGYEDEQLQPTLL
jgi:hypothetical protein